jgi:hypothetical protein
MPSMPDFMVSNHCKNLANSWHFLSIISPGKAGCSHLQSVQITLFQYNIRLTSAFTKSSANRMNSAENSDMATVMTLYAQRVLVHARVTRAVADEMPLLLEKKMKPPFSSGASILLSPKDMSRFFVHSRWQYLLHRWLTLGRPRTFFHGPWFLTMPDTELVSQIQQAFGEELHEYQLQIQKTAPYPANEVHPNKLRL